MSETFSPAVRDMAYERAKGRCEIGGEPLPRDRIGVKGWDGHHRLQRSTGGLHTVTNCLVVCRRHHNYVHDDLVRAYTRGWMLASWENPASTPVNCWDGWYLFTDSGGMLETNHRPKAHRSAPSLRKSPSLGP